MSTTPPPRKDGGGTISLRRIQRANKTDKLDYLWSSKRVREFLDVPERTLRRLIASGKFSRSDVQTTQAAAKRAQSIPFVTSQNPPKFDAKPTPGAWETEPDLSPIGEIGPKYARGMPEVSYFGHTSGIPTARRNPQQLQKKRADSQNTPKFDAKPTPGAWAIAQNPIMDSLLRTAHSLAYELGLPREWLIDEANAGRIPCLRVGQRILFNIEAVQRALAVRASTCFQEGKPSMHENEKPVSGLANRARQQPQK